MDFVWWKEIWDSGTSKTRREANWSCFTEPMLWFTPKMFMPIANLCLFCQWAKQIGESDAARSCHRDSPWSWGLKWWIIPVFGRLDVADSRGNNRDAYRQDDFQEYRFNFSRKTAVSFHNQLIWAPHFFTPFFSKGTLSGVSELHLFVCPGPIGRSQSVRLLRFGVGSV